MSNAPPPVDASFGGGFAAFPSTCWSRFLAPPAADGSPDRAALDELARRYWKPIYSYIRSRRAKTDEDARDLTQDFFLWMIEKSFLDKADPRRGRFRAFVKVSLDHYLGQEERKIRALKRGGGARLEELEKAMEAQAPPSGPDAAGASPEEILDRAWKRELLFQATSLLEAQLRSEGREVAFALFRDSYSRETAGADYAALASKHRLSEREVFNHLRLARKRGRDILLGLVAQTVRDEDELNEELDALFGRERP